MDTNQLDPKIIEKIQKLINLEEGARAIDSKAEAENAASRIQEMLMKYNLDREQVMASQIKSKLEFFDGWIDLTHLADKRESFWVSRLYYAIARNNLCKAYPSNTSIWIIGEKHQVALVQYIAEQLLAKIRIAEKMEWKKYDADITNWQKEKRGTWRRGFYQGAAHGIDQRLERDGKEMEQTHNPFAVMIINKKKMVDDYMDEKYFKKQREEAEQRAQWERDNPKAAEKQRKAAESRAKKLAKRKGPRQISSNEGWRSGYDAGLNMEINKGIDHKQQDNKSQLK